MPTGCTPWPDDLAARYRADGWWRGRPLGELLRDRARKAPERTAQVAADGRRWSYAELDRRADGMAAGLHALGLRSGDRVVVHLPNVPELLPLCFALFRLGALPVMALPAHREAEVSHLCEAAGARAYVIPDVHDGFDHRELARTVAAGAPQLEHVLVAGAPEEFVPLADVDAPVEELRDPDPGDVALFLLSGGTTGLPKLIPRTHDDFECAIRLSAANARLGEDDVYLAVLPITHNYALAAPGVLGTLMAGGAVVLAPGASPGETFPLIARERVSVTGLVPPLALLWTRAAAGSEHDLSSLRLVQVGGAAVTPELARRVGPALGCRLQQSFGMAEGLLSQSPPGDDDELVATTQGRPLSAADEVRVVDRDGRDLPPGETGELLVRGPYTIRGYYRAADHNARAFTADGFLRTGDLVRRLESGHLQVAGRLKDVVNRGGEKVPAEEVEDHLLAHPAVDEVAVVAMPDDVMGERTCAFVVADAPPTRPEVGDFLRERGLAAYKLPDRVEPVPELPQTHVGKVDKARLREAIADTVERERSALDERRAARKGGR